MDQKILDALKTINDKLGGTNDPNENWGSLLQEIAQNVGSGGGGGGTLVVRTEYVSGDHGQRRLTETAGTIIEAFRNGVCVILDETVGTGTFGGDGMIGPMPYINVYEDNASFYTIGSGYYYYANSPDEYPVEDMG